MAWGKKLFRELGGLPLNAAEAFSRGQQREQSLVGVPWIFSAVHTTLLTYVYSYGVRNSQTFSQQNWWTASPHLMYLLPSGAVMPALTDKMRPSVMCTPRNWQVAVLGVLLWVNSRGPRTRPWGLWLWSSRGFSGCTQGCWRPDFCEFVNVAIGVRYSSMLVWSL